MGRHAAEAELADRREVLGPRALHVDRVPVAVDSGSWRALRRRERAEGRIPVVAVDRGAVARCPNAARAERVGVGGRSEHEVIEQIDLGHDPEIVRDVDLRIEAQAEVRGRLRLVVALAELTRRVRLLAEEDLLALAPLVGEGVVPRLRPEVLPVPIEAGVAAEREVVEELAARAEVAVDLDDRTRVRPPVFAVDLGGARADRTVCRRPLASLLNQLLLIRRRIDVGRAVVRSGSLRDQIVVRRFARFGLRRRRSGSGRRSWLSAGRRFGGLLRLCTSGDEHRGTRRERRRGTRKEGAKAEGSRAH